MTTASALLEELQGLGIELQPHGEALRFRPRDRMTAELVGRLRDCKAELLEILQSVYVYETPRPPGKTAVVLTAVPQDLPTTNKGGRPTRVFKLSTVSTSTKPPETREIRGCVDVDSVDASETQNDDWGEV